MKKGDASTVLGQTTKDSRKRGREGSPASSEIELLERRVNDFVNTEFQALQPVRSTYLSLRHSILQLQMESQKIALNKEADSSKAHEAYMADQRCKALTRILYNEFNKKETDLLNRSKPHLPLPPDSGYSDKTLRKPDDPNDRREPAEGLNDEERRAQIIAKVAGLSGQPLAQLWASLVAPASGVVPKTIPTEPPGGQLYASRPDRSQSAPEFIEAVYKDFLHGDFTRADLRRIDPKAEMALRNWERDHKTRAAINLPTIKERNDTLIAAGLIVTDDPAETARRAIAAANRAKRNTKI